ncbi:hypothetical protein B9Z55_012321 [Caenorhabditis nigoni]|uniref:F-box domain-containing protein n=1 Tax=Caenorhabditis nigoni TaxID=1611254 RepID=A0A2G5TXQ4_9PELO|nr:hypothetical protein B9Z55_012321 [Caenorhabditis nigoni]
MSSRDTEMEFSQLFGQLDIQNKEINLSNMIFHEDDVFRQLNELIQTTFPESSKPKIRFPLLKLPQLVLLECIENLDVLEIILFSLLSKRAKTIAKLIRWNPLDIQLGSDGKPQIQLRYSLNPGRTWITDLELSEYPYYQSSLVGPTVNHYLFMKNNGNAIEDLKQMAEHICEVFRSPIREITIVEQSLIDWIIKFQPTIPYLTIEKDVITSVGTLDCIFEDLKVTKHFVLNSIRTPKKIQCTEPISFPSISIHNSYWFTVPLILNGNNSIIRLYESKLTPKDINTILKEWQKGAKLQNLKYLEIQTTTHLYDNDCSDEIFKYLYPTSVHRNEGRPKTVSIDDEWTYTLPEVVVVHNITRSDGMTLSVFGSFRDLKRGGRELFLGMQVWHKQP